jgi:Tol biopolymer transport system component
VRFPTRYEADIHLIDPTSGSLIRQLTRRAEGIDDLAWSPDGGTIAFGTFGGLWQVEPDGEGTATRVTPEGPGAGRPQWAPSGLGSPMALVYQQELRTRRIVVWRSDASDARRLLLPETSLSNVFPALSPDGRRVALESDGDLWTTNTDGTDLRRVAVRNQQKGEGPIVAPQWSPDGERLAYSASTDGQRDVYVAGSDGGAVVRLTSHASLDDNPSWSHDGRWVYFRSDRGGLSQIWKAPAAGGEARRVTEGQASQAFESRDGRTLYFVRGSMQPGLWATAVDGGDETLINTEVFEHFWGLSDTGIAFMASPAGEKEPATLKFLRFEDRSLHVLTRPGSSLVPGLAVSRDGATILWSRTTVGVDIMLVSPWVPPPASPAARVADRPSR